MPPAAFRSVQPVLPTRDIDAAIAYYARLGFALAFHSEPGYAGVRRDAVELHLQAHDPAEWSAVERPSLRFVIADVAGLYAELADKDVFHAQTELRDTSWGTREFAFFDLDQNALTFYEDL